MVSRQQGKRMVEAIVKRYSFLEEHSEVLKNEITEQDISTKFVLPMLQALNWDPLKMTLDGPEIHEKGFREKDIEGSVWEKVRHGLPDFSLRGIYSKVPFFVEVKHPAKGKLKLEADLRNYRDGHLVFLTSFKESQFVVVGKQDRKYVYRKFKATSPKLYVKEFDNFWEHISNTREADGTRRAIKATRLGLRKARGRVRAR